jgi:hypothetical protein
VGACCASTAPAASIGRRAILASNDVVPFLEAPDQDATEVDRPDAVVDLLETHRVVDESIGNKENPLLERNVAALVTRFRMKWPGYSNVGSSPV